MPTKSDLHWQTGKTKEEGKRRDLVEYSIRLLGSRGMIIYDLSISYIFISSKYSQLDLNDQTFHHNWRIESTVLISIEIYYEYLIHTFSS